MRWSGEVVVEAPTALGRGQRRGVFERYTPSAAPSQSTLRVAGRR